MKLAELTPQEQYRLSHQLMEGEELQWLGRPEPFPLLSKDYKGILILRWSVVAVVLAGLILLYSIWAIQTQAKYSMILLAVLILACIYIFVVMPLMDRLTLMKRTFFCITSKRALVFVNERAPIALNRAGLKLKLTNAENGCFHIALGAATRIKPYRLRSSTITPPTDDRGNITTGAVFYSIKDAVEVTNLLSRI